MSSQPDAFTNPYVGPRAFNTGEQIYGRDRETEQLVNLVVAERIVLLYSPSGAGKTSLIQAALIPRMLKRKFNVQPVIRVNLTAASANGSKDCNRYVFSTLLSLEEGLPAEQQIPIERLAGMSLLEYLDQRIKPEGDTGIEVLLFDQFEEILTLDPTDQDAKRVFFRQIGEAIRSPNRWALFSMREDYVAALAPYLLPVPTRFNNTFRLDLLGNEAARVAIQEPARQVGVEITDAVTEKLVDDLRRVRVQQPDGTLEPQLGPYVEPVQLQVVCHRLWDSPRPDPQQITLEDIDTYGRVDQSLVDQSLSEYYARSVLAVSNASGVSERTIREWFDRRLVTEQGVRGTVLMEPISSGGLDNHAISRLIDAHLVRGEKRGGTTWFELVHDRLIGPIREDNAAWFEANLSLLQKQADLWNRQGRPENLLLRNKDLATARSWATTNEAWLLPTEQEFLDACRELEVSALRLKRRNQAISVLGLLAMLLAAIALVAYIQAAKQRDEAERQASLARSGQLAALSQAAGERTPIRSLLLALEAVNTRLNNGEPVLTSGEEALHLALKEPHGIPIGQQTGPINDLAISPDGRWLATAGNDGTAQLWDLQAVNPSQGVINLHGHDGPITKLAFSPDGHWLATGSQDKTAHLWNLNAEDPSLYPIVLRGHEGSIISLAISPDGHWLATGSEDETARLWDLRAQDPSATVTELRGHNDIVGDLAFSPDSRRLATTGYNDATVRVWDLNSGDPPKATVLEFNGFLTSVAFSPDGRWMAVGGAFNKLFDRDLVSIELGRSEESSTSKLSFSPDGRWLVAGELGGARLWDLRENSPAEHEKLLRGHDGWVEAVAFSPDGGRLITASDDNTARVWDLTGDDPASNSTLLRGHDGPISAVDVSQDGRWMVTGGRDGGIRRWELTGSVHDIEPLLVPGREIQQETISEEPALTQETDSMCNQSQLVIPGGRWLATCSADSTVRLWDLRSEDPTVKPVITLEIPAESGIMIFMASDPKGRWLATRSDDIRIWDLNASDPASNPVVLSDMDYFYSPMAFSPDGHWLAIGSSYTEGTIKILDMRNPEETPVSLDGSRGETESLNFSPDGGWLAAEIFSDIEIDFNTNTLLWNLNRTGQPSAPVELDGEKNSQVSFSPDGRWMATIDRHQDVTKLWDLSADVQFDNPRLLPRHGNQHYLIDFSPDGRWLAVGSDDNTILLYDLRGSDQEAAPLVLSGHDDFITSLDFSSDSRLLATGSWDKTSRIWDLSAENPSLNPTVLRDQENWITNVIFSPDGRWLITGDRDDVTQLWHLKLDELLGMACRIAGRNFSQKEWELFFPEESYRRTCPDLPAGS